jgi:hypothetical protein
VKHQKMRVEQRAQIPNRMLPGVPEPEFVSLLRIPGIDSQAGGPKRQPYVIYRPARLHRLAESIPGFFNTDTGSEYLSYIYLGSSVCLSSCHIPSCRPVTFLSSCHICGTLSYSLRFSNQTDQGDETEGLEREGLRWRDRKGTDCRGRV